MAFKSLLLHLGLSEKRPFYLHALVSSRQLSSNDDATSNEDMYIYVNNNAIISPNYDTDVTETQNRDD